MGHNGFLVTPEMFTSHVYNYKHCPEECKWVDDIWFSGWLTYNNVKIWSIGYSYKTTPLSNWNNYRDSPNLSFNIENDYNNNTTLSWFHKKGIRFKCRG
jgi:hypothetical protein